MDTDIDIDLLPTRQADSTVSNAVFFYENNICECIITSPKQFANDSNLITQLTSTIYTLCCGYSLNKQQLHALGIESILFFILKNQQANHSFNLARENITNIFKEFEKS